MLRAHRQAWTWQDEWYGLTMADIRAIEKETQELLKKKMQNELTPGIIDDEESSETNLEQKHDVDFNLIDKDTTEKMNELTLEIPQKPKALQKSSKSSSKRSSREQIDLLGDGRRKLWSRNNSRGTLYSPGLLITFLITNNFK